jgi:CRISPR system Cascade subunit CasC
MPKTIIDIHILQTLPPSNINRDDQGSPKSAFYGGVQRARVSSQAWKRAARLDFRETATDDLLGVRTKNVVGVLASTLSELEADLDAEGARELAELTLKTLGLKLSAPRVKKGQEPGALEAGYLVFFSNAQLKNLARVALEAAATGEPETELKARKKELKQLAKQDASIDVSLFGRMVADDTDLNIDAACQVAHALSVHAVHPEADYFTAVDDAGARNEDEAADSGAAMIGVVEFSSSTLYRYATIDVDHLQENLGSVEATKIAVKAFVRSFVTSMPSGKQNTFANRTLPDLVVVQMRDTQPVNLVGAFERPVTDDHVRSATTELVKRSQDLDASFGTQALNSWVVRVGDATAAADALGSVVALPQLVDEVAATAAGRLEN